MWLLPFSPRIGYLGGIVAALYFISDIHLGLEAPDEEASKESRLLELLKKVEDEGERLYIVGDLFDFWFEYRHAIPSCSVQVLAALRRLSDAGVEVHYIAGNHDFALGTYLSDQVGCILHIDPFGTEYAGTRFYLHHGDGLAGRDLGYRILKKVIRSPISQALWRLVHPDIGFAITRRLSGASRRYTQDKDYGRGDRLDRFLAERCREGYDYIIMGHFHLAEDRLLEGGSRYINLGGWLDGGSPYARFEGDRMDVVRPDGTSITL